MPSRNRTPTQQAPATTPSAQPCDTVAEARATYVREILRLYLETPGVAGHIRHSDRTFAGSLFDLAIPLYAVERAFVVAAFRRERHNAFSSPLPAIRSLLYFRDIIREMLERPPGHRDIASMREAISRRD